MASNRLLTEIAVNLGEFRNIDLFHQGLYRIHLEVYQETAEGVSYGFPVHFLAPPEDEVGEKLHALLPQEVNNDLSARLLLP